MIEFIPADTKEQFGQIAKLADTIWREYYTPIIGIEQVEYMIENFQSSDIMYTQYANGFEYFMIYYNNHFVGYIAIQKQKKKLFVSKFYISKQYRGKKIGKAAMAFVEEKAIKMDCKAIKLYVNKNNANSIVAYEALGFENIKSAVTDIGNGFIMDDYKMEKRL